MEASALFDCLEIDVIIDASNKTAMVHHDIDDPSGLPLSMLLQLKATDKKRLWLDVKNLSDGNAHILLDTLSVFERNRDNTLIEVSAKMAGSPAVSLLSESGFKVSYYLPTRLAVKCSSGKFTQECRQFATKVEHDLQSGFSSLSFDYAAKKFVSNLQLPEELSMSTWDLQADLSGLGNRDEIENYNMFIVTFTSDFNH